MNTSYIQRKFSIFDANTNTTKGTYKANKPNEAAKKIATKLFKTTQTNMITFSIREITRNTKKKIYHYKAFKNQNKIKIVKNKPSLKKRGGEVLIQNSFI